MSFSKPILQTSADQKPDPNVRLYNLKEGKHISTMIATKESTWKPQWSDDESWCLRLVGSEILFHKNHNYGNFRQRFRSNLTQNATNRSWSLRKSTVLP